MALVRETIVAKVTTVKTFEVYDNVNVVKINS
jgi:hypothetical protein